MPVAPSSQNDANVTGPLGGLVFGTVRAHAPMMMVRAVKWYRDLARLGIHLPFFMVHDVGLLYAAPREQIDIAPRAGSETILGRMPKAIDLVRVYRDVVSELAQSEASVRARTLKLNDDLIVVILARVLGSFIKRIAAKPTYQAVLPMDPELVRDIDGQLPQLFPLVPRTFELSALEALARARLHVLTIADALDLDEDLIYRMFPTLTGTTQIYYDMQLTDNIVVGGYSLQSYAEIGGKSTYGAVVPYNFLESLD